MTKYETSVHKGNGCIVRVHKPILTKEEHLAWEHNIKNALVEFTKEVIKNGK